MTLAISVFKSNLLLWTLCFVSVKYNVNFVVTKKTVDVYIEQGIISLVLGGNCSVETTGWSFYFKRLESYWRSVPLCGAPLISLCSVAVITFSSGIFDLWEREASWRQWLWVFGWGGGGACRGRQLHTTHECARSRRQDKGSFTRSAIHGPTASTASRQITAIFGPVAFVSNGLSFNLKINIQYTVLPDYILCTRPEFSVRMKKTQNPSQYCISFKSMYSTLNIKKPCRPTYF